MSRLTPWDCWVLTCYVYTVVGYAITGWVAFHPADANLHAVAAVAACFGWALGGLVYAERDDTWLARL